VPALLPVLVCCLGTVWALVSTLLAAAPTVTRISVSSGPAVGGTSVTIAGGGFVLGSTVEFGGRAAIEVRVDSANSITARSPAGAGTVAVKVANVDGSSRSQPGDQFAYDPAPTGPWLGLDGNSGGVGAAGIKSFIDRGVAYDRGIDIEPEAGETPSGNSKLSAALAASIGAGMTPDVIVDYVGYRATGGWKEDSAFPHTPEQIEAYVDGFVRSAKAILQEYPGRSILFEPMNEPWGYTTPRYNAAEYADVIARLLPQARRAGIPPSSIYVGATGADCGSGTGCVTNGWVAGMYAAQPALETEVQGWYVHPYGPPSGVGWEDGAGIESVPLVRSTMLSGENNILVSEVGYCARDVNRGVDCGAESTASGAQAAKSLTAMLENALRYREAGWLKALVVYARNDGGWSMELPDGEPTEQGEALEAFAQVHR
jgi:hypothetical protein